LHIEAGDRIDFSYDKELNKVILTPRNKKIDNVRGMLSHYAKDKLVTDDEMREAIGKYITEKFK
jgi:hypothetical protein